MSRITKRDPFRGCYVIDPDSTGNHIQKLGELEDRDEVRACVYTSQHEPQCCGCGYIVSDDYTFCPWCGQRLKWESEGEE